MSWDLAEAEKRLGDVVDLALTEGPQTITRGDGEVVVISAARLAELLAAKPFTLEGSIFREELDRARASAAGEEPLSFKEFLLQGESFEGLDLTRDPSPGREIDL